MVAPLIDTHCHLNVGELGEVADDAWARAQAAGVHRAVVIGIDAKSSAEVVAFAAARNGLFASVGIHPTDTSKAEPGDWERIVELASAPNVVALGESGLDLYWKDATLEDQVASLNRHAELAIERDLPLVLHIRDAYPKAREVLTPHAKNGLRGIIHCFAGQADDIHPFVSWGWAVSFSGILTYKKAPEIREAARRVPLEQCLVETDAPWLPPVPHRKKTNEPAFVVHTAQKLAEVKELPFEEVAAATTRNAERFFRLPSA